MAFSLDDIYNAVPRGPMGCSLRSHCGVIGREVVSNTNQTATRGRVLATLAWDDKTSRDTYDVLYHVMSRVMYDVMYDVMSHVISHVMSHVMYDVMSRVMSHVMYDVMTHVMYDVMSHVMYDVMSHVMSHVKSIFRIKNLFLEYLTRRRGVMRSDALCLFT